MEFVPNFFPWKKSSHDEKIYGLQLPTPWVLQEKNLEKFIWWVWNFVNKPNFREKKKETPKLTLYPQKGQQQQNAAANMVQLSFFLASGIWSTQTSFLSYRRLYGLLARERTTHNGSLPKSGGGIQRPKGGSLSFSIGTGAWQLASRSVGYEKKSAERYLSDKQKTSGRKRKKITDIWVNFNFKCQMFRVYDHLCDIIVVIMPGN